MSMRTVRGSSNGNMDMLIIEDLEEPRNGLPGRQCWFLRKDIVLEYIVLKLADRNRVRHFPELDGSCVNTLERNWFLLLDEFLEGTDMLCASNLDSKDTTGVITEDPAVELERHNGCAGDDKGTW
jgi:hypothetical protein